METGRELDALDALIAEKVMGESKPTGNVPEGVLAGAITSSSEGGNWVGTTTGYASGDEPVWIPRSYSSDIEAAWKVVEKMRANVSMEVEFQICAYEDGTWSAEFGMEVEGYADTAPHAICLAALAAVGALPTPQED